MRFHNGGKFINDGTQTEKRWCLKRGIKAYPIVQSKTYKAPSGKVKNYVKIEIDCQGKILEGKKIYKQEMELTEALEMIYAHYYSQRFGNKKD